MAPIFLGLALGSALPVVKICLVSVIGAVLAHKVRHCLQVSLQLSGFLLAIHPIAHVMPQKILKPPARQALSQLIFFVFMPTLVFSKLSAAVDVKNLTIWWPLPANVLLR